ncbi:hypothetical protein ACHAW6_013431 [Cyclotella cf. meneghiniana]
MPPKILPLPPQTIDLIAAGEVVQRPSAIIKELIENSLDASSTSIDVHANGFDVTVSDNGCGIDRECLKLACTRFATSKIADFEDLKRVKTFGFRGEALASCSMVGRVAITSRVRGARCAYRMNFRDGAPVDDMSKAGGEVEAKPCAGKEGTTIQVQDLFYNVPSRRRAMEGRRNEREEYERILAVVQRYAVHEARRGVGFMCRGAGKGGKQCDLNTQSLGSVKRVLEKRKGFDDHCDEKSFDDDEMAAVKEVIGHVYGSDLTRELLPLRAGEGDVNGVGFLALKAMARLNDRDCFKDEKKSCTNTELDAESVEAASESKWTLSEEMTMSTSKRCVDNKPVASPSFLYDSTAESPEFSFAFKATGLITNSSYSVPKSSAAFLLFINDRLVESQSLRRAVESIYSDTLPRGGKPFIYLSLDLPGPHVDVNVHPTKKEVALLHEDRLCDALAAAVKEVIGSATSSRTFVVAGSGALLSSEEKKRKGQVQSVIPCKKTEREDQSSTSGNDPNSLVTRANGDEKQDDHSENPNSEPLESAPKVKRKLDPDENKPLSAKKTCDPSRLVRTNRAALAGALEPFLVKKESKETGLSDVSSTTNSAESILHVAGCPLASQTAPDMTVPGAFATAICRCQVRGGDSLPPISNPITVMSSPLNIVRPKKVTPTDCDYNSITKLRADISARNHQGLNETLRGSTYVGAVSRSRSLIQSGIDLLMIDHRELAREMFYQLALLRFSGMPMAELGGGGVDVMEVIAHLLEASEMEDLEESTDLEVSKTNCSLARQATCCLAEKAPMLEEYFSIRFEWRDVQGRSQRRALFLTGLPICHTPQPHALPVFLIRLATEVDWTAELPCFQGICTEIGSYYAELPVASSATCFTVAHSSNKNMELIEDEAKSYVKHILYPAIAHLVVPPKDFAANGTVLKLANLTSLYKVFERC